MNRIEYMIELAYNLSEDDCWRLFGVSRDLMLEGKAVWNYNLEYAYNEYMMECEDTEE